MSFHGHDSYLQIGKETTYGTKPATVNEWVGIVQTFSPEENNNLARQNGIGSRNYIQARVGSKAYSGSIEYLVQNFKMFEYALGTVAYGATPTGEIYTHTVTEANDLPSFTAQAGVLGSPGNFVRDFTGCKVDTLTLTAEREEALTCEAEFIAQSVADSTTGTAPVADTSSYFTFYEGSVTIDGTPVNLVEEFELEITNNLESLYALGSDEIVRLQEGQREYTATIGIIFEESSQYALWKNATEFSMELKFVSPDGRELKITCSNCKYDTNEIELSSEDYMIQTLEAFPKSVSVEVKSKSATSL